MAQRLRLSGMVAAEIDRRMHQIRKGAVSPAHADVAIENDDEIIFLRELEREIEAGERNDALYNMAIEERLRQACLVAADRDDTAAMDFFDVLPAW